MEMEKISRKKKKADEPGGSLIHSMTVSLFIIILAFFILLNAISVVDEKKKKAAVGSIADSFGGLRIEERNPGPSTEKEVFSNGVSPIDFSGLVTENDKKLKGVAVKVKPRKTILRIPESLLFSTYGRQIERRAGPFMKKVSGIIKANQYPIEISVHTDNTPIHTKATMTKRALTVLRSQILLAYLIEKEKIPVERITAYGWGEYKPLAPNNTRESRAVNRRVEIAFVHGKNFKKPDGFFIFKDFFFNISK